MFLILSYLKNDPYFDLKWCSGIIPLPDINHNAYGSKIYHV